MRTPNKDINLLAALEGRRKRGLSIPAIAGLAAIPVVALVAAVVLFAYNTTYASMTEQRDGLERYVQSPQTIAAYDEAVNARQAASLTASEASSMRQALLDIDSYPQLYREDFVRIYAYAGLTVEVTGFMFDPTTGLLTFQADASELGSLPYFIERMRSSGMFTDIQYLGYERTEENVLVPIGAVGSVPGAKNGYFGTDAGTGSGTATGGSGSNSSSSSSSSGSGTTNSYSNTVVGYRYNVTCQVVAPEPELPATATAAASAGEGGE